MCATLVPPAERFPHDVAADRYPIACSSSARVLDAQGCADAAATVRRIGAHVGRATQWPEQVCLCAIVPCTERNWTHTGHCCRRAGDHDEIFMATHTVACRSGCVLGSSR